MSMYVECMHSCRVGGCRVVPADPRNCRKTPARRHEATLSITTRTCLALPTEQWTSSSGHAQNSPCQAEAPPFFSCKHPPTSGVSRPPGAEANHAYVVTEGTQMARGAVTRAIRRTASTSPDRSVEQSDHFDHRAARPRTPGITRHARSSCPPGSSWLPLTGLH